MQIKNNKNCILSLPKIKKRARKNEKRARKNDLVKNIKKDVNI
jgi:hypothetical protein